VQQQAQAQAQAQTQQAQAQAQTQQAQAQAQQGRTRTLSTRHSAISANRRITYMLMPVSNTIKHRPEQLGPEHRAVIAQYPMP